MKRMMLFLLFLLSASVYAQAQHAVSGKVTDDYILPSILENSTINGASDGNWYPSTTFTTPGFYKLTIDLNTKVLTAVPVTVQ